MSLKESDVISNLEKPIFKLISGIHGSLMLAAVTVQQSGADILLFAEIIVNIEESKY